MSFEHLGVWRSNRRNKLRKLKEWDDEGGSDKMSVRLKLDME